MENGNETAKAGDSGLCTASTNLARTNSPHPLTGRPLAFSLNRRLKAGLRFGSRFSLKHPSFGRSCAGPPPIPYPYKEIGSHGRGQRPENGGVGLLDLRVLLASRLRQDRRRRRFRRGGSAHRPNRGRGRNRPRRARAPRPPPRRPSRGSTRPSPRNNANSSASRSTIPCGSGSATTGPSSSRRSTT